MTTTWGEKTRSCLGKCERCLPITVNERFWIEIIRLATFDRDPPPMLKQVQHMRQVFDDSRLYEPHSEVNRHG